MKNRKTSPKYSPELRERAVRMVLDHAGEYPSQWAAIEAIAGKLDCTPETLRRRDGFLVKKQTPHDRNLKT